MLEWFRGKTFSPPTAPLRDYWVTIHVRLHEPLAVEDGEPAGGYFRILGVRCTPLRLRSLLEERAPDGAIVRDDDTHWHEVSLNDLDRRLRASLSPADSECVWHESGRIYFPASPEESRKV